MTHHGHRPIVHSGRVDKDDLDRRLTPEQRRIRDWGVAHPGQMSAAIAGIAGLNAWSLFDDWRGGVAFGFSQES